MFLIICYPSSPFSFLFFLAVLLALPLLFVVFAIRLIFFLFFLTTMLLDGSAGLIGFCDLAFGFHTAFWLNHANSVNQHSLAAPRILVVFFLLVVSLSVSLQFAQSCHCTPPNALQSGAAGSQHGSNWFHLKSSKPWEPILLATIIKNLTFSHPYHLPQHLPVTHFHKWHALHMICHNCWPQCKQCQQWGLWDDAPMSSGLWRWTLLLVSELVPATTSASPMFSRRFLRKQNTNVYLGKHWKSNLCCSRSSGPQLLHI